MKAMNPYLFRTGDTLDVEGINLNADQIKKDLDDVTAQRWTHHCFTLEWNSYDHNDTQGERQRVIKPPATWGAFEIEAIELVIYAGDSNTYTLTLSGDDVGAEDLSVDGAGTATTKASGVSLATVRCLANTEMTFELDSAAASWSLTRGYAIVHVRHDRHQGPAPSTYAPVRLDVNDTDDPSALNTQFTNLATDTTSNANAAEQLRIEVVDLLRNEDVTASGTDARWSVPSRGEVLKQWDVFGAGTSGQSVTVDLDDEGAAQVDQVVLSFSSTGALTKSQGNALDDTQGTDDPDAAGSDYTVEVTAQSASALTATVVLYWEK